MAYLLVGLTAFQFILHVIGLRSSPLYIIANPYAALVPFIFIWLGAVIVVQQSVDRNLFLGWLIALIFPSVMLRSFSGSADFFFLFLRGLQFFWGPLIIIPGLLGFFRIIGFVEEDNSTARRYIVVMALLASSVTLLELFSVHILGLSPLIFPWVSDPANPRPQDINPFRPWGITAYPQPNALVLAYLFWLSLLYGVRGVTHKLATFSGVILAGSGTGAFGLIALAPLAGKWFVRIFVLFAIPVIAIFIWATATHQYAVSGGLIGRFDLAYAEKLSGLASTLAERFLAQFSVDEFLFGTRAPTAVVVVGLTHDWAYLDVFYAYGLIGLVGYVIAYGGVLFLSTPGEIGIVQRIYFALVGLILNFHYGSLNYFVGQFLFSTLAALQLNRAYSLSLAANRSRLMTGHERYAGEGSSS